MIYIYAKNMKNFQRISFCLIWSKKIIQFRIYEGSHNASITIKLTTWSSKVLRQFDLLWKYSWKNCEKFFIDVQNIKYVLLDTYFCLNSIKIEN